VLARNWRGGGGELDLVVRRGPKLRLVEVKTRAADDPVGLESVGPEKQRRLIGAAQAWLREVDPEFDEVAFMVALVEPTGITFVDDAFDVE
jgi:putative endonuclease